LSDEGEGREGRMNAPGKQGKEKANDPHSESKDWHVRIVDVRDRSSDLWIWTIFLLEIIKIEFHPADGSVGIRG
jgi:hypothetical protein